MVREMICRPFRGLLDSLDTCFFSANERCRLDLDLGCFMSVESGHVIGKPLLRLSKRFVISTRYDSIVFCHIMF